MVRVYAIDGVVPYVHPETYVHPTASLIGDVIVEAGCYIGPGASLRGDFGRLVMRRGSNLQDNCIVHGFPRTETVIEEEGHIGHGAVLHGCRVGRNALIGMSAVIMDGAVIGADAIVAALAFVKAGFEVPPGMLVAGIPARILRTLSDDDRRWKATATREYQELARRSLASMTETVALRTLDPARLAQRTKGETAAEPLHLQKRKTGES
ncbi:MAG TPA: phenylacetic acid degradation protein PaaY [Alphaproteobacteria bacterium]|nr:phenylacetic acid degradation protein PaaY [Alphaproteobacteria bacterium]